MSVVLSPLLCVISDELLLIEGVCPSQNGGRLTGVGQSDEGDLADKRALCCHQDEPKVAVLAPSTGTLD